MRNVSDLEIINLETSLEVLSHVSEDDLKKLYRFVGSLYLQVESEKKIVIDGESVSVPEFFKDSLEEIYSLVMYEISERFSKTI